MFFPRPDGYTHAARDGYGAQQVQPEGATAKQAHLVERERVSRDRAGDAAGGEVLALVAEVIGAGGALHENDGRAVAREPGHDRLRSGDVVVPRGSRWPGARLALHLR